MGASQSNPRRVTVINDEATGVIKISDSVVERLQEEMMAKKQQQGDGQQRSSASQPPPSPSSQPPSPPPQTSDSHSPPPPPPIPPMFLPPPPIPPQQQQQMQHFGDGGGGGESSLSALKVRAQKEEELRNVEDYWQNRVRELRNHQLSSSDLSESTFRSTVEAVDKMFLRSRGQPICQESRHAVMQCYQKNRQKSLLCADEVRAFASCVESARTGSLGRSG